MPTKEVYPGAYFKPQHKVFRQRDNISPDEISREVELTPEQVKDIETLLGPDFSFDKLIPANVVINAKSYDCVIMYLGLMGPDPVYICFGPHEFTKDLKLEVKSPNLKPEQIVEELNNELFRLEHVSDEQMDALIRLCDGEFPNDKFVWGGFDIFFHKYISEIKGLIGSENGLDGGVLSLGLYKNIPIRLIVGEPWEKNKMLHNSGSIVNDDIPMFRDDLDPPEPEKLTVEQLKEWYRW